MDTDRSYFEIREVTKSFPGVKALKSVSMSVGRGEVRALVGENGAGKSTLMKILNGNQRADSGSIYINGEEVHIKSPLDAVKNGISIIFQELNCADNVSIMENLLAGRLAPKGRLINWKSVEQRAKEYLDMIGFTKSPRTLVSELSVAEKQLVEIAKALSFNANIILMDEPSAMLTDHELKVLFQIIRDLKAKDVTVIYISHRMEELFEICDSVTVLRDGEVIDTRPVDGITQQEIVEMMVGRSVDQTFPKRDHVLGEELLRVENLRVKGGEQTVSFNLRAGEIIGFSGLVGAGRTETLRALFGFDYNDGGDCYVRGKKVKIKNPKFSKTSGIAFLTEDRKTEGLILDFPIRSNICMAVLGKLRRGFIVSRAKCDALADDYIQQISIKTPNRMQTVGNLSGGNQQKVVLAKWLATQADIFLMDEPTRGIDVNAKMEIYRLINSLAKMGKGIIFVSSELPEILGMCDRVFVMKDFGIAAELSGEGITAVNIMQYALQS